MMRPGPFSSIIAALVLLCTQVVVAQETKLSKSINRSFDISGRLNLEVSNKYGNVIVETHNKNEVALRIELIAFGKDESSAEKLMERVEFDFKNTTDYLQVESVFDRKQSFFKEMLNSVNDYSASLLSKHKLQVNYEITVPENTASISIVNRFGDVHIADMNARLDLTVSHGNLRLNDVGQFSRINVSYGKARIHSIDEASVDLKGAELDLDKAGKLTLTSSTSTALIGSVDFAELTSTNDKITIESVREISGTVNFTSMQIYFLEEAIRLNQSYGDVTIKNIQPTFRDIRLNGKSTDYQINFQKSTAFDLRINTRDDKLQLPDFPGKVQKRYLDEKSKFIEVSGYVGAANSGRNVSIDAQSGLVKLVFIDPTKESYNK
ncbi:MAG: hypothetical protein U5K79_17135 [Cyclobacteriaceae bacterium]|nr:hypothetical protein [Cyclobacteriaceae bacterium]